MPAFDVGNVITLVLALLAAASAWGASRQKQLDQGREIDELKRRVNEHDGTHDEVIRLQEQLKAIDRRVDTGFRDLRDDIRAALRPQPRRKAEVGE